MTFGGWILIVRSQVANRLLVAHELVHVRQWREAGRVRFLSRYLRDYLRGRFRGVGHWTACALVPFEVEAHETAPTLEPRLTFISSKSMQDPSPQ